VFFFFFLIITHFLFIYQNIKSFDIKIFISLFVNKGNGNVQNT